MKKISIIFCLVSFILFGFYSHGFSEKLIKCSSCSFITSYTNIFCPSCGSKLVKFIFCPDCGDCIASYNRFCPKCGVDLVKLGVSLSAQPLEKEKQEKTTTRKGTSPVQHRTKIKVQEKEVFLDLSVGYGRFSMAEFNKGLSEISSLIANTFYTYTSCSGLTIYDKIIGGTQMSVSVLGRVSNDWYLSGTIEMLKTRSSYSADFTSVGGYIYVGDRYEVSVNGTSDISATPILVDLVYHEQDSQYWFSFGIGYYIAKEEGWVRLNDMYYDPAHYLFPDTYTYGSDSTRANLEGNAIGFQTSFKYQIPLGVSAGLLFQGGYRHTGEIEVSSGGLKDKLNFSGLNAYVGLRLKL